MAANCAFQPPICALKTGSELAVGVYAVYAAERAEDGALGSWMAGVANYGRRPTVNDRGKLFEVHLLDQSRDLYGKTLKIQLIDFIRPETKFDGLDALRAQIAADSACARELLGEACPVTGTVR